LLDSLLFEQHKNKNWHLFLSEKEKKNSNYEIMKRIQLKSIKNTLTIHKLLFVSNLNYNVPKQNLHTKPSYGSPQTFLTMIIDGI